MKREPPVTPWGITLEKLREAVEKRDNIDLSQYRLCELADIQHSTYRQMLKKGGEKGPGLITIQNLLDVMKWKWSDFVAQYDSSSLVSPTLRTVDELPRKSDEKSAKHARAAMRSIEIGNTVKRGHGR